VAAYRPAGGGASRETSDEVCAYLLRALGVDPNAARLEGPASVRSRERRVGPVQCISPEQRLARPKAFGIWANLYSLRGANSLGVGNLGDLRNLIRLAAAAGASFVGVSPLHATRNLAPDISPYQPLSRFFGNPLYLDVQAAPEWQVSADARREFDNGAVSRQARALEAAERIDYAGAAALQGRILERLHATFQEEKHNRESVRTRAYRRFEREGGERLRDFATFCALEEELARRGHPRDWRRWPREFRSPKSEALHRFRAECSDRVSFHTYLQFEFDRQRGSLAAESAGLGLDIGLYPDLALGSAASGFDTWAFPEEFVSQVSLGAPPDDYAREGQNWGFPPLHPWRVAENDCAFWRALLRANFAQAGMLRIDHVLGVVRQFWIPAGQPAARGAYVRFPATALLGALAEESRRDGTVVVGEDLGTVPRGFPSLLARFGVLSSRVMLFERTRGGGFRPAHRYSTRALVSITTHDLPPLAAFLFGRDLELRREIGLFDNAAQVARARREREETRRSLLRRLVADGDLASEVAKQSDPPYEAVCIALHRFLGRTSAPLVSVSLDDLAGETEPVNLPGVSADHYPSWTRRMRRSVDALARDSLVDRTLATLSAQARGKR